MDDGRHEDAEVGTTEPPTTPPVLETDRQREYREQEKRIEERASVIGHEVLILSGKGGVGKSTVATNLAWALALRDLRVGLLDADIHGPSIPLMTGLSGSTALSLGESLAPVPVLPNLQVMSIGFLLEDPNAPVIWRGPLRAGVIRQFIADVEWGPLDFLIVDLPPGTGDEPLTVAQCFPGAAGGVIVATPQEASLADCRKAINFVRAVNLPVLGVIENMSGFVCPHCGTRTDVFASGGGQRMAEEMGVPYLGGLPLLPEIVRLCDEGRPIVGTQGSQAAREAFAVIVDALVEQVEQRSSGQ
jgi:ATP-binding protein involved in chromosome partitioning